MENEDPDPPKSLRLVASTGELYCTTKAKSYDREKKALGGSLKNSLEYASLVSKKNQEQDSNVFRSVEWIADGTSFLTVSEDNLVRTFIAPPDLLTAPEPHALLPYHITSLPSTPLCISPFPGADLQLPSSALFLTSHRSQPIQLRSFIYPGVTGTYPVIKQETEQYIATHSLTWTPDNLHFLAGTRSQIHLFDVSREKDEPLLTYGTGKSHAAGRHDDDGADVRGIVSTLATHPTTQTVAAGTYTRRIHLYSSPWQDGDFLGCIELNKTNAAMNVQSSRYGYSLRGGGVTQVAFTDTGTHLLVAERQSTILRVYDIRNLTSPYAILIGHQAYSNQKIGVSVGSIRGVSNAVVAGGADGFVRVWCPFSSAAATEEGIYAPVKGWKAAEDPVTAASVNPLHSVVATSSGYRAQRPLDVNESGSDSSDEEDERSSWDNGVRVWDV
ncbi:hypothetical protein TWF696_003022 [Orbilia brochopaga]|uniref:WD40 repeat-like protein n=1 Tax=Orbilia brochopaga TaxID=3140254 RepID=A0AAV9TZ47_9PEZI